MKIYDVHTHVLPGVDDGAATMEDALEMLRNAVASDVELLAVTPHYNGHCAWEKDMKARFDRLQEAAKDIPVQLVLGAEVLVNDALPTSLAKGKLPTINDGRYLLTEFPQDTKAEEFIKPLQDILKCGYIPLVAHPERYAAVCEDPRIVIGWLDMGCHLQLTGGSVLGHYGRTVQRTATFLLKNDLVACIASDAHGVHIRSNYLLDVWDHLVVRYSKQYAFCLLCENPRRICCDEAL